MNKTIEIIVSPQGETRLATGGFAGAECQQASRFLEDALGTRQTETLTPEFHYQHQEQEQQGQSHADN